jgi:hypothetical protein
MAVASRLTSVAKPVFNHGTVTPARQIPALDSSRSLSF